jgi:hypothetical protein
MRRINLIAQIDDRGRIFISGDPKAREVSGLCHMLDITDSLDRELKRIIEINDAASGGYKPPEYTPPKNQFTR